MKIIDLNTLPNIDNATAPAVLKELLMNSPQKPLTLDEQRRRMNVANAIDKCLTGSKLLKIEDSDHVILCEAIKTFPWSRTSNSLLAVLDAVLDAATPKDEPEVAATERAKAGKEK